MMKCNSCSSTMLLTRKEADSRASTEWRECPVCGSVRMTTEQRDIHDPENGRSGYADGPATPLRKKRLYA